MVNSIASANANVVVEEEVPEGHFKNPIDKCDIIRPGADVTVVSWGSPLQHIMNKTSELEKQGISCELLDLCSIYPIDYESIATVTQLCITRGA